MASPSKVMSFFMYIGQAKRTYRTGWVLRGIKEAESIADHMYRMSIMSFLAPPHLNRSKLIEMCLIHDLPECIVGDLTPSDNVSKEEKHKLEDSAMATLCELIEEFSVKDHLKQLFEEYSSHASNEANYVKSLDLLDMYLQAYEYELINGVRFDEFFSGVPKNISDSSSFDPQIKKWIKELVELRENKSNILPKDSNLNTILRDFLKK